MRAARLAIIVALLSLLAPLAVVTSAGASPSTVVASKKDRDGKKNDTITSDDGQGDGQGDTKGDATGDGTGDGKGDGKRNGDRKRQQRTGYVPANGVTLSNPMTRGRRNILNKVIRSVQATKRNEYVRVVVWNYDDRAVTRALLNAHRRGVNVQVVVANSVVGGNWNRTRAELNRNRKDESFAVRCRGGCRSKTRIMHSKYVLFSKIGGARKISMFGSFNLTTAAGNRQWNDMVTTRNFRLYDSLLKTFNEYARDRAVKGPFEVKNVSPNYQVTLWPSWGRNTIASQLKKVACRGARGGAGGANGRTVIRIAIAGWFDAFGTDIAKVLRRKWEAGCDVKVITTLAGRGINQTLKNGSGRGPVPIRQLTVDRNADGVPERYLHMKAMTVNGVFNGDRSARVLFTGSPNWSSRAQRSDEILFRISESPRMVRQYAAHINRLFRSPWSHLRTTPDFRLLRRGAPAGEVPNLYTGENVPDWFELD